MEFDLERYLRASRRLDLDGIDWDEARAHPLSDDEVRCLTYMMDIETHTIVYLRELLSTPAAEDPEVTAFLSLWVYEEFWHGQAIATFLEAAGRAVDAGRPAEVRASARDSLWTRMALWIGRRHPDFVALHMVWGAINELSTLSGYERLIHKTRNPVLADLLRRIVKDERRHFAFYADQARRRLLDNPRAQRMVRFALKRFWAPVGTGVRPQDETDFVVLSLFGGIEGEIAVLRLDAWIAKLPGLEGLALVAHARELALTRAGVVYSPKWQILAS